MWNCTLRRTIGAGERVVREELAEAASGPTERAALDAALGPRLG